MSEKGKSTPPQREETEKGFPVPVKFIAVLAIVTLAIIFGPSLMAGTGTESGIGDEGPNQPPAGDADTGADVIPTEVVTETATPTQETGVKLLKKLGPFAFPEYGEKVENTEYELAVQQATFEIGDLAGGGGVNSHRSPGMNLINPAPGKNFIMLMIYRDANGDPISVSKKDEKTGSLYFARKTYDTYGKNWWDQALCNEKCLKTSPKTWEVLVYSY